MTKENQIVIERTVDGMLQEQPSPKAGRKPRRKASEDPPVGSTAEALADARERLRQMEEHSRVKLRGDKYLWGIYLFLLLFSVVELYSASASEVRGDNVYHPLLNHGMFLLLGFGIVWLLQNIHYKYYRKWAWGIAVIAVGLVYWGNTHGELINGAMRSIEIAGFTIQPPEIAKLALVVILARVMSKNQMRHGITNRGIVISLGLLAAFGGLLYANGLTNTMLIVVIASSMLIIGGTQMRKLLIIGALFAMVGVVVILPKFTGEDEENSSGTATEVVAASDGKTVNRDNMRKGRIADFLEGVDPGDSITDQNRQVYYANMSQAHGGVISYPGKSRESARLPLAFSDYIYSVVIEDWGFVGGVLLLLTYLLLLARAGVIATKCTKAFPALLITGCATMIVSQAIVHMFIVVGLMPVSGQPLPFISKGGTSIIVMSAAMGMMLSVSKFAIQNTRKKKDANLALKEAVDDADTAANPTSILRDAEHTDPLVYK